ncbi:Replication initiator protein A (RepA) N-terminus [Lachnospiraceae bacterium]|nr:Replication initiator protein A (RepA) N-terminus [Lachnospiraceae bacterium]
MRVMFDYIVSEQSNQFDFIRIPRALITERFFSNLSLQAKVLYGILMDRMALSSSNNWLDQEGRVFIVYPIDEIQIDTGLSKRKILEYMSELEKLGLIERRKRGNGKPNCIYVKNFIMGIR